MSGKEDLIPGLTDQIPEKPTCSLTQPHSLIDGCIDGMKSADTDPGYVIAGGGVAAGTAAILKKKYNWFCTKRNWSRRISIVWRWYN